MFNKLRNYSRKVLRMLVKHLTCKVLDKHKISIIAVIGHHGTEIAREALYSVLLGNENVRRNTKPIWWDMSIPLTILGSEDKKRSIIGWNILAIKSWIAYFLNKPYPHKIIIEMDTKHADNAKFWSDMVAPTAVLLINSEEQELDLYKSIIGTKRDIKVIYSKDDQYTKDFNKYLLGQEGFNFGVNEAVLTYKYSNHNLRFKYKGKEYISNLEIPIFEIQPIVGSILTAIALGEKPIDISKSIELFELHPNILENVYKNIN